MDLGALNPWNLQGAQRPSGAAPGQLPGVARASQGMQFEQLLLRQTLQQLRRSSLDASPASPVAGYVDMADDHLAAVLAAGGGLGIAASVDRWTRGIQAYRAADAAVPAATAASSPAIPALPALPALRR